MRASSSFFGGAIFLISILSPCFFAIFLQNFSSSSLSCPRRLWFRWASIGFLPFSKNICNKYIESGPPEKANIFVILDLFY